MMYEEPEYLTMELLSRVLAEYEWPVPYVLEDDLPDGIIMTFPKSHFVFAEPPDGGVRVGFLYEDTGHPSLQLGHAFMVIPPPSSRSKTVPLFPGLIPNESPFPSEEKTVNGIRNACMMMLRHLVPVIEGDFSWVSAYEQMRANPAE